jgi:hypothetical protein
VYCTHLLAIGRTAADADELAEHLSATQQSVPPASIGGAGR